MLAQQAVADLENGRALAIAARLDGEVAFGVGAHRAIVHVGRADAQEAVVDHHDLGMDHGVGRLLALLDGGIEQPHAIAAGRVDAPPEADAAVAHGMPFDPGIVAARRHDHHLQLGAAAEAIGQPVGDQRRAEELVLDVDLAFGQIDRIGNSVSASRTASSPS